VGSPVRRTDRRVRFCVHFKELKNYDRYVVPATEKSMTNQTNETDIRDAGDKIVALGGGRPTRCFWCDVQPLFRRRRRNRAADPGERRVSRNQSQVGWVPPANVGLGRSL